MKTFKLNLQEEYPFLQGGTLSGYVMDAPMDGVVNWQRPALIVVPGGGYHMCSKREGEIVALDFSARGFQTFVIDYKCGEDVRYPEQLFELSSAVDYVRKHAEEFHVNPEEIFVMGFSAGGHLAGNLAVEHQNVSKKAGITLDCKPTAVALCYPVISQIHGHQGSYEQLLKGYSDEEKAELYKIVNLDQAVNEQTPPAFIWSTVEDKAVPTDNALRYALALDRLGIAYELHVYPQGHHGLSLGSPEINAAVPALKRVSAWMANCKEFFMNYITENI